MSYLTLSSLPAEYGRSLDRCLLDLEKTANRGAKDERWLRRQRDALEMYQAAAMLTLLHDQSRIEHWAQGCAAKRSKKQSSG